MFNRSDLYILAGHRIHLVLSVRFQTDRVPCRRNISGSLKSEVLQYFGGTRQIVCVHDAYIVGGFERLNLIFSKAVYKYRNDGVELQ